MIRGAVYSDLEATLRLTLRGPNGQTRRIKAIIDTGFDGFLTLPEEILADLNLEWKSKTSAILADGSETEFDTYRGIVIWDRRRCPIDVDEANMKPLVGTALLAGFTMTAEFRPRGIVTIKRKRRGQTR